MKPSFLPVALLLMLFSTKGSAQSNYTKYVNPFIGTGGHGHTFPGAVLPFGMVQLSPDTRADDSWDGCSGYHYNDSLIYGFSHTHLSGTGCSDWADILLMPFVSKPAMNKESYASRYSHRNEKASPGFYLVFLEREGIQAELTVTKRTGIHRYTYPMGKNAGLLIDLLHRDRTLSCGMMQRDSVTFTGFRLSEAWARDQHLYFAMRLSKPVRQVTYASQHQPMAALTPGKRVEGAWLEFGNTETLVVEVAISLVSEEGALNNLKAEAPHHTFESYKESANQEWEKQLGKIEVSGAQPHEFVNFYSSLYHCSIHPSLAMDVDRRYRGRDNKIHVAEGFTNYSVFSLWDTYRALNPLLTILEPERSVDFINTFLAQYKDGGRLPVWELSANETDCMIGFHSVAVIADAWTKGLTGFDQALAYDAMKAASSYSGFGQPEFNRKGYLQVDDEHESVSKTLEYAYDNWCIAQVARRMNKPGDVSLFTQRSQAWRNLFDPVTGFMRPRRNGGWLEPFSPVQINNHFTEGNSWQYSFYVPQDIEGLIRAHGGKAALEKKLDELFNTTEKTSGREQADVTGLIGQYAHGNEPSHHMAYLYDYVGAPQKAIQRVRQIRSEFYSALPDGLIGNEDCGQMSAWYVFSAMGFYPVCPASGNYVIGAPLFPKMIVHLPAGKTLTITSDYDNSPTVLSELKMNGAPVRDIELSHDRLMYGGRLDYIFAPDAKTDFTGKRIGLTSLRSLGNSYLPAPLVLSDARIFKNTARVSLSPVSTATGQSLYYTLDGKEPCRSSLPYSGPFEINTNCTVKVKAYLNGDSSTTAEARFFKAKHDYPVTIGSGLNAQYTAGGPASLVDGIYGETEWRKGEWLGVQGRDFEAIVDFREPREVSGLALNCLQDTRAWIVFPTRVSYYASDDGNNFILLGEVTNMISAENYQVQTKKFEKQLNKKVKTRYVKVIAHNFGKLPAWHIGQGGEAHLFADELELR